MKLKEIYESFTTMIKSVAYKDAESGHQNSRPKEAHKAKEYDKAYSKASKKMERAAEKKEREDRLKS